MSGKYLTVTVETDGSLTCEKTDLPPKNTQRSGYDTSRKVILLGDAKVGKTQLFKRITDGMYKSKYLPTIGTDFNDKTIYFKGNENTEIKLKIWDTAGQERFQSLGAFYYRNASAVVFVYAVNSRESFNKIREHMDRLKDHAKEVYQNAMLYLVGNQCDLDNQRQVPTEEAREFAQLNGMTFIETSAAEDTNVDELFAQVAFKTPSPEVHLQMQEAKETQIDNTPTKYQNTLEKLARLIKSTAQTAYNNNEMYAVLYNDITTTTDALIKNNFNGTALIRFGNALQKIPDNPSWGKIILGVGIALVGLAIFAAGITAIAASFGATTPLAAVAAKHGLALLIAGIATAVVGKTTTGLGGGLAYSGRHSGLAKHMHKFSSTIKKINKQENPRDSVHMTAFTRTASPATRS